MVLLRSGPEGPREQRQTMHWRDDAGYLRLPLGQPASGDRQWLDVVFLLLMVAAIALTYVAWAYL